MRGELKKAYYIANIENGGMTIMSDDSGYNEGAFYLNGDYKNAKSDTPYVQNKIYSLSSSFDGSKINFFENNKKYVNNNIGNSTVIKSPTNNTILILGNNPYNNSIEGSSTYSKWLNGKVYSVRIYNRALTDEEVAHNYEIDKERFGIED